MKNIYAINEIAYLRGSRDFLIDTQNNNRYRIMVKEKSENISYCFSCPIYKGGDGLIINTELAEDNSFSGTNCFIKSKEKAITVKNSTISAEILFSEKYEIVPTQNGAKLVFKANTVDLSLKYSGYARDIRNGGNWFAVMTDKFTPCLSINALYGYSPKGIFPITLAYSNTQDGTSNITVRSAYAVDGIVLELGSYEPKLFQDTTVESLHPTQNNVYSSIAFIGKTNEFGEQWLYSRPDFSKISELYAKKIYKAILHIPVFDGQGEELKIYFPERRFCSFGSNWEKKIPHNEQCITAVCGEKYLSIDVTEHFRNPVSEHLTYNEGLIFKKTNEKEKYVALSTGDSYLAPQILEIRHE